MKIKKARLTKEARRHCRTWGIKGRDVLWHAVGYLEDDEGEHLVFKYKGLTFAIMFLDKRIVEIVPVHK